MLCDAESQQFIDSLELANEYTLVDVISSFLW